MSDTLKLLCVLAHPDDETLGNGGMLARYAAEGVETHLVTATRGQRGWFGDPDAYPGPVALGRIREAELHAAAEVLDLQDVVLLDYMDGELDRAEPAEIVPRIVAHLRRVQPQVVVTFDPFGAYGHPDHIAISQFTTAAVVGAADPDYARGDAPPHRAAKLYYMAETQAALAAYEAAFGDLVMQVDGEERRAPGWTPWAITTRVDTSDHAPQTWRAVACHRSQLPGYQALQELPEEHRRGLWSTHAYYRALSFVNAGRELETDLFEGVRGEA